MNLSHLYYFKKLAEVQHYTRAAKELFIAQPTLSAAISQLEKELGAPLFQKHTRAVSLTSYGQDFYGYVSVALQNLDKGIDVVQQRAGKRQSTVRVGVVETVQDRAWARGVRLFRDSMHGDVQVDVQKAEATALLNSLKSGNLDVIFTDVQVEESDIRCMPYRSSDLVALVNKLHKFADRASVSLEELQEFPLISYNMHHERGKALSELLEKHGITVDIPCSDPMTMCSLVSVDVTYTAIAVSSFATNAVEGVVSVPINNVPRGFLRTYICYRDGQDVPPVVQRFLDGFIRSSQGAPVAYSTPVFTAESAASLR